MNPPLNIKQGDIARAAELISGASALIVAAGAGMSDSDRNKSMANCVATT